MTNLTDNLKLSGRKPALVSAEIARELGIEDLAELGQERGTPATPIKALRAKHHRLAKALATGVNQNEAAYIAGFTPSRVSILRHDPTFAELEQHYRELDQVAFLDVREKMADLAEDAIDVLHDRLSADPDAIQTSQLLTLATAMTDRTGNGPTTKTEIDVKVGLADRLKTARLRQEAAMKTIEGEVVSDDGS